VAEDLFPILDVDRVGDPPATASVAGGAAKATEKLRRDLGLGLAMFEGWQRLLDQLAGDELRRDVCW
jgi:hypothetical protein